MPSIRIGTCGYAYREWTGIVYPPGTKAADYLRCYAALFSTVELDFSYYAMPKKENLARMLDTAGPNLSFSIKAYQSLTHHGDATTLKDEAASYRAAIEPLVEAGRLGAVLFQFPYSFHYVPDNRRYLAQLLDCFRDVPCAVEFRTAEWYNERVIEGMRQRKVSLAMVDTPALKENPPFSDVVTGKTAYIRMHGRNKETWWGRDAGAKFDYCYNDSELDALAKRIEAMAKMNDELLEILVYFNNHPHGASAKNAGALQKLLLSTPAQST
jgi:uncharacterized protein YecE (DUF72 family)